MPTLKRNLYNFVHSHGKVADLAYKTYRGLYKTKESLRPMSPVQFPDPETGLYKMNHLNIAITAICNAKCVFCVHHLLGNPVDIMPMDLFSDILKQWSIFCPPSESDPVNLTPSAPPGEPLTDPNFLKKMQMVDDYGYRSFIVTNGILLQKFTSELVKFKGLQMGISFPSFNTEVYKEVYGVDRGQQVTYNIFKLLEANAEAGEPIDIRVCFRNKELPSEIMKHPNFQRLKGFFSDKVSCMFTTWWDTWNGGVKKEDMERGEIKVRDTLNLNRICGGAMAFSMRPTDRLIRLCGCRYIVGLTGKDDLVVGDLNDGFRAAQQRSVEIQNDFKRGVRQKTCLSCSAYNQAT